MTGRGRVLAESAIRFRPAYLAHITRTWSGDERSIFADLVTRFADEIIATPPLGLEEPG
ncbi:MAG: hypothetical protein Q8M17_01850 [Actinomycetota bacterium]|nr:hypothetical protein [Actinomycetota bacterium]